MTPGLQPSESISLLGESPGSLLEPGRAQLETGAMKCNRLFRRASAGAAGWQPGRFQAARSVAWNVPVTGRELPEPKAAGFPISVHPVVRLPSIWIP